MKINNEPQIEYFNPKTNKWVKKLPKSFIDKIVKTRWINEKQEKERSL